MNMRGKKLFVSSLVAGVAIFLLPLSALALGVGSGGGSDTVVSTTENLPTVPPVITPSKPAGNWILNSNMSMPRKLYCTQKKMVDRIRCRLSMSPEELSQELSIQYLPEECRALSGTTRTACVTRYKALQTCWDRPDGEERFACAREVLKLNGTVSEDWATCIDLTPKAAKTCQAGVRASAYNLAKFYLYDLSERAEATLQPGSDINPVVDLEYAMESLKQKFNKAKNSAQRLQYITSARSYWKVFLKQASSEIDTNDNLDQVLADLKLVK